jgi:HEAT repeat protein/putative zinc finger protein
MNCREYQHQITLLFYEELPEKAQAGLQAHLEACGACQSVYESEKNMHSVLAEDASGWDFPSDLLVESRRSLADELDRIETKRSWWRVPAFSVVFTPMRLLESAALVAMGLALGVYVSNIEAPSTAPSSNASNISVIPRDGSVSNVQVVNANPATGEVELAGEVSQPIRFQGSLQDDNVRRLLFNALRDANNPGSRLRAVEILAQKPTDEMIEEALINAMVYDDNPGVRLRALEGLQQYAAEKHVRSAFMNTLANDDNAGIRVEAIEALTKQNAKDNELAKTIEEVTKKDDNPYIRTKALQFVGTSK